MRAPLAMLALVLLLGSGPARAQDALLDTVDSLMAEGRFDAALAILDHAQGSPASIAGRRGLCLAELGRRDEGHALIAEALRSSGDPWVAENRETLISAMTRAPSAEDQTGDDAIQEPSADTSREGAEVAPARIPAGIVERFGSDVPADAPLVRRHPKIQGSRLVVRASLGFGLAVSPSANAWQPDEGSFIGSVPYSSEGPNFSFGEPGFDEDIPRAVGRIDAGAEVEYLSAKRVALVSGFDLGLVDNARMHATAHQFIGREYFSLGDVDFGPGLSARGFVGARFLGPTTFLGLGVRLGVIKYRGEVTSTGDAQWIGGMTAEGIVDVGVWLGRDRGYTVIVRNSVGVPTWSCQVLAGFPLFRSAK